MASVLKNKEARDFVRTVLLLLLFIYITVPIIGAMGLFTEELRSGVETTVIKDNKEYFEANGYTFDNADGRSNEMAFEGSYSVKLTPENQYGYSITLGTPKEKEEYEGSVWFYEDITSADTSGWAFLVTSIGKGFWKGAHEVVQVRNGWKKLEFKITIPDGLYKDPLVIYCWNSTKNNVYFDDLVIKRQNYMKFFRQ